MALKLEPLERLRTAVMDKMPVHIQEIRSLSSTAITWLSQIFSNNVRLG